MTQVFVKYNPYKLETILKVNGQEVAADSSLYKVTKGKRLQEWVGEFPQNLRDELNTMDFSLEFYGMPLDWDDFREAFEIAERNGLIYINGMTYIEGKNDENVSDKIQVAFRELRDGPIEDFKDPKLLRALENTNAQEFPVNVIATMSSGKSTLINALLQKKLMPAKNEACTAVITEILDNGDDCYSAEVYNENNKLIRRIPELNYDVMGELNDAGNLTVASERVSRISIKGNIPFLESNDMSLMLVDTPGPNNAQNQEHKNTTYRTVNNDSNNLILYVLNGTQLKTNDDANLLRYVAEQMKKGGKQMRDRFLFVINKMDQFDPDEEDIGRVIESAKQYLAEYGIEDPQLFPCSAFTALNIRMYFSDIDIDNFDNLPKQEKKKLPQAAKDTMPMIEKFIDFDSMHLEKYSTLSPSAQETLNYRLAEAVRNGDTKEQALIHSGIYSIEAAITAYVTKYAKTKKVKDLVETFQEILESNRVIERARESIATNERAAKELVDRATKVKEKIKNGQEAAIFKKKIQDLDPMPRLKKTGEQLKKEAAEQVGVLFRPYGEVIYSREEAKRLVSTFSASSSDAMAKLASELDSAINTEIRATGERLLFEYQEKLSKFDDSVGSGELDFKTEDMVKCALNAMRENAERCTTDDFATTTVDDLGETTYEEKVYYDKVGEEEVEEFAGTHQEPAGTRKVKDGSHREKVGTRQVRNPAKRWWKIFTPKYITEDVYETVDDYREETIYETVVDYKTVMRDIYEERREKIEKYQVKTTTIQAGLIAKMRQNLDEGVNAALTYAEEMVEQMKEDFSKSFDELDRIIQSKYEELEKCAKDQKAQENQLEDTRAVLQWIETCQHEIDEILDI